MRRDRVHNTVIVTLGIISAIMCIVTISILLTLDKKERNRVNFSAPGVEGTIEWDQ